MQKTVNSRNHSLVLFNPLIGPLSDATTSDQSGPGSDGNEGVLCIPQRSSITGTSSSDCLVSYWGHSLRWGSYPSAEKQPVYSTVDWAPKNRVSYLLLWWPIYAIMNSFSFININPIYSRGDFLPAVEHDSFGWTLLPTLLTLLFCIHVLLFNTLVPSIFFSSMSSFWPLAGHNTY